MSMSLAKRVVLVVLLALVGVGAAATAMFRSRQESDAARAATAAAQSEAVANQLRARRDGLSNELVDALSGNQPPPADLLRFTAELITPLGDASAGYCLQDGRLVVRQTIVPKDISEPLPGQGSPQSQAAFNGNVRGPNGMGILPLDRDVVMAACRGHKPGETTRVRFLAPNDVLLLTVVGARAPYAWALGRTPKRVHSSTALTSPLLVGAIVLSMVLLVGLSIDTVLQVRKGTGVLANALVAVQTDLKTSIPQPKTLELAHIADGLRALTAHLSESRMRELELARRLSHEQRLASLGRVAAGVAHEIRNPLAGIKLRLDAMARRPLDERSARDVSRSLSEVARLDNVISSLLLVARRQPADRVATDVGAVVDERLAGFEDYAAKRGVGLRRAGAGPAVVAEVDPVGMARVIDNLVHNAIDASPPGGEVTVELRSEGGELIMRVLDRGPGVLAEHEAQLFEPFFTSKPSGTGLGLSLSRAAVDAHGGSLKYSREQGLTCFTVRLPGESDA